MSQLVSHIEDEGGAGATFDADRIYRYALWRVWDSTKPRVAFVMLNPSTADEHALDPTVRRCKGFAELWNFGGLVVYNIFALRSTDPAALKDHTDPIGPRNDEVLWAAAKQYPYLVCAWGVHGAFMERGDDVRALLNDAGSVPRCLGLTADGHPKHPLYLAKTTRPREW